MPHAAACQHGRRFAFVLRSTGDPFRVDRLEPGARCQARRRPAGSRAGGAPAKLHALRAKRRNGRDMRADTRREADAGRPARTTGARHLRRHVHGDLRDHGVRGRKPMTRQGRKRGRPERETSPLRELESIARTAPKRWRTRADLRRAGFRRVAGGLPQALRAARLARLTQEMKRIRRQAGLTQAEVARRMGTSASVVSRMESEQAGNLTLATLQRFADAVGARLRLSLHRTRARSA